MVSIDAATLVTEMGTNSPPKPDRDFRDCVGRYFENGPAIVGRVVLSS